MNEQCNINVGIRAWEMMKLCSWVEISGVPKGFLEYEATNMKEVGTMAVLDRHVEKFVLLPLPPGIGEPLKGVLPKSFPAVLYVVQYTVVREDERAVEKG